MSSIRRIVEGIVKAFLIFDTVSRAIPVLATRSRVRSYTFFSFTIDELLKISHNNSLPMDQIHYHGKSLIQSH